MISVNPANASPLSPVCRENLAPAVNSVEPFEVNPRYSCAWFGRAAVCAAGVGSWAEPCDGVHARPHVIIAAANARIVVLRTPSVVQKNQRSLASTHQ